VVNVQVALSLARSGSYAKAADLCPLVVEAYRDSDGPGYPAASGKLTEWARLAAIDD
jgi:hypothetical protein